MSMVSAKEFSDWLRLRFGGLKEGVSLTRSDINQLTGRQNFSSDFVNDIHFELMRHGLAFVTDTSREEFYLVPINKQSWRDQLEQQFEKEIFCNIIPLNISSK
ncbi:hypothetical protein L2719_15810 [Shewanella schlegeliana]|uniref:Uncharacterized protein n=1 Tax=Shewanella schlegeliana TaxID=190308 RepID=A0ABS1T2W0_9GAMM|nr:hypothetical protein [Shewanella schlegeliana]MBL4915135.1 hypothetical protein [Shewanella schlegeliana]MCL1110998.1 hypothetical protein [Shewanella schlegeliana]GIU29278.1 hypothetical protein TUM4433_18360 [Shewanella schlegeliana]